MFKEKMKGFIAGICVMLLLTSVTVFAVGIDVYMEGIRVYWDGVEKTLRDEEGKKVEPMIYEGTTYVPIRAMSQLMGKTVEWDQATTSVFVGGKPVEETLHLEDLEESKIDRRGVHILTGEKAKFNLKDQEVRCDNLMMSSYDHNLYILDGKYTRLVGKAVMPYTHIGQTEEGVLAFYSVENDGTEHEIVTYELKQTEEPVDVEVNLRGVENLKIRWVDDTIALYNVDLLSK